MRVPELSLMSPSAKGRGTQLLRALAGGLVSRAWDNIIPLQRCRRRLFRVVFLVASFELGHHHAQVPEVARGSPPVRFMKVATMTHVARQNPCGRGLPRLGVACRCRVATTHVNVAVFRPTGKPFLLCGYTCLLVNPLVDHVQFGLRLAPAVFGDHSGTKQHRTNLIYLFFLVRPRDRLRIGHFRRQSGSKFRHAFGYTLCQPFPHARLRLSGVREGQRSRATVPADLIVRVVVRRLQPGRHRKYQAEKTQKND